MFQTFPVWATKNHYVPGNDHISWIPFGTFESMILRLSPGGICYFHGGYSQTWIDWSCWWVFVPTISHHLDLGFKSMRFTGLVENCWQTYWISVVNLKSGMNLGLWKYAGKTLLRRFNISHKRKGSMDAAWPPKGQVSRRGHTVDGRNPANQLIWNIPLFTRLYTSQVVQDFFHQQYCMLSSSNLLQPNSEKKLLFLLGFDLTPV